jgi:hypothetical protein
MILEKKISNEWQDVDVKQGLQNMGNTAGGLVTRL